MSAVRLCLPLAVLILASPIVSAQPTSTTFDGAKWIWSSLEGDVPLGQLMASVYYFRAELQVPRQVEIESAELIITADNLYAVYLNGVGVGECEVSNSAWGKPKRFDVTKLLAPGKNVVAVEAVNTLPGPAGLIAKLEAICSDGSRVGLATNGAWKCFSGEQANWYQPDFDDAHWFASRVVGDYGTTPWGAIVADSKRSPPSAVGKVHAAGLKAAEEAAKQGQVQNLVELPPKPDYRWPDAILFLTEDRSLNLPLQPTRSSRDSLNVTIFNPRKSRGFPEHDLPAPMKVGAKLMKLQPARPGTQPQLLVDAGKGAIGSPTVSFDGKWIYFSMAYDGAPFYHIYRQSSEGGPPEQLTDGPFHDIDPAELPDGRVVFTSTRIGTYEEYHNPPSRAIFVMRPDGTEIRPLTHTIIFDNEPEILADGRILFVRSDNFFDRGKVETLLHAIHPDGSDGYTEFGLENGPEYGGRLRAFICGSPAPLPNGRVAFVSRPGITIGRMGQPQRNLMSLRVEAGDVAALPDNRLLCTTPVRVPVELKVGQQTRTVQDLRYRKICVVDAEARPPCLTVLHESPTALHSPVFLGPRRKSPQLAERFDEPDSGQEMSTGILYCQNARLTLNKTAGWSHVRAIRVLAAQGLTNRSSHSYIVHAGSEVTELGTVPLAPDGSFSVEVPADTPIAFQAVDAEGRSELNEMSWIYVRPGEQRGCVGCHHKRESTPPHATAIPLASRIPPLRLLGQGEPLRFRGNNAAVTGLMELQFDRYREIAGINRHDMNKNPLATGSLEVEALMAQLRDHDDAFRSTAARRLALFRAPKAATALAETLEDSVREVRVAAAFALATCGNRDSVYPLIGALSDRSPLVAQAAAIALENMTGHAEPFDPFVSNNERRLRAQAWRRWFGRTTWEEIEHQLITQLMQGDFDQARRAAVALGHSGSIAATEPLRAWFTRERNSNPFPDWRRDGRHRGDAARFNAIANVNPRTLQAVTRSIGYLQDTKAIALLAETLSQNQDVETANLFLAEAAVEALGRIGTPEAEDALVAAFAELQDYPKHTYWYGDHPALMACHAAPVHYLIAEALDAIGSRRAAAIVPHLIRSVPIDPDRALLLENDDCESIIGRVIRRQDMEPTVVETCLALLGDPDAIADTEIQQALSTIHRCWAGHPTPENRAAQILSLVCRDPSYEPRVRAAFQRYEATTTDIPRVFDTGIPVVLALPLKNWVCFYLARTLGNLKQTDSMPLLIATLEQSPTESANGYPDPLGPGVLFLHNGLTPCWRAAVAWALGQIGDRNATPVLLATASNLRNAIDTRHAAARALARTASAGDVPTLRQLAKDYPEISTRRALWKTCREIEQRDEPLKTAAR